MPNLNTEELVNHILKEAEEEKGQSQRSSLKVGFLGVA
jgi:hypothetical protein